MQFNFTATAACLGLLTLACSNSFAGAIAGTVRFEGDAPKMKPIDMGTDPVCHSKHTEPLVNEALVLGEGQTMGNVFVEVVKGLPEGKTYDVPTEPAILTQEGCQYRPHVFAVRAGQTLKILNPDGTLHNVNGMAEKNKAFNRGMPKTLTEIEQKFETPEPMFPIKCDVHPWMRAYCAVTAHPFYDITEKDGAFRIEGLEPGEYEIKVWHEVLKEQTATVTVPAEGDATSDFTYTYKKKS